jgi:hypothetical protein
MPARDAPWRSIVVAAQCLRTWAPLIEALIPAQRGMHDMCHGGAAQRPDRSQHLGVHLGRSQWRSALAQVTQERVAEPLPQKQRLLAPGFAVHGEQPLDPVDVGKPEPCDFACVQTEPGGPIPRSIVIRRRRTDHLLYVFSSQKPGNG